MTSKLVAAVDDLADRLHAYTSNKQTEDPRDLAEALVFLHLETEWAMSLLERELTHTGDNE